LPRTPSLFAALLIFAAIHFVLNTLLLAVNVALKQRKKLLGLWWSNYSWVILTYTASASAAGIIFLTIEHNGLMVILAAAPIVAVIFATCHFYFRQADERARAHRQRVEAAEAQARQADRHAQELAESEERFRSAFHYAAIGVAIVGADGKWLQVNRALCSILGYSEEEILASSFQSLTHPDDVETSTRQIAQLLTSQASSIAIEKRYVHKLGHTVWAQLSASIIKHTKSQSLRFIFQIQDITDKKRAEQKLAYDAFHDALTGLPNRSLFVDHLQLAMARLRRNPDQSFAVLFLDIDRFKVINDSLGHVVGDHVLVAIARRLEAILRPVDTVARFGGDEFTILIEDISSSDEAVALAERIQKDLREPFNIGEREIFVGASIGISLGDVTYQKPDEILRDADTAMYRAKSSGRARYTLFEKTMHARALSLLQLETDLRRAVERQEFFVVYQPIVSLETGRLMGFEALARWRHPERGVIPPADFIPLAEETGHINTIGRFIIEEVCNEIRHWNLALPAKIPITTSINLSARQFANESLAEQIVGALERAEIDPRQIKFEITESVVMEDIESAIRTIQQLRDFGIQLSIDDFGTGYSSLSYLHRLPIDALKIDRSFVSGMEESNENAEIVRTIIALGRSLGMSIVAEGVETLEQLNRLRMLGCGSGQGYFLSVPVGAELARLLVASIDDWRAFQADTEISGHLSVISASEYTM
jgi:diguanylate cyclase (GGDEF)-like protein/PAS domain S-box-containing protein